MRRRDAIALAVSRAVGQHAMSVDYLSEMRAKLGVREDALDATTAMFVAQVRGEFAKIRSGAERCSAI